MPSFSSLKTNARRIVESSNDDDVQQLADVILKLARECEELERKLKHVESIARQALNQSR